MAGAHADFALAPECSSAPYGQSRDATQRILHPCTRLIAAGGVCSHLSQSWVRGCARRARRASPSSVPAAEGSLPRPAEGALRHGLEGAPLLRSAKMRSARAARALLGRELLSLNALCVQDRRTSIYTSVLLVVSPGVSICRGNPSHNRLPGNCPVLGSRWSSST